MTTSKRITLNKLISYVLNKCEAPPEDPTGEEIFDITQKGVNQIEEIKFSFLPSGKSSNLSDFPESLKEIFDPFIKEMFRHGTNVRFSDKDQNPTLLDSILSCLMDSYNELDTKEKEIRIRNLRDKLLIDLKSLALFKQFEYKELGWRQKDLTESIKFYKNNRMVLRFISDYFNINIFLLNVLEDKVYAVYGEPNYNTYKATVFLSFYEDSFEPITYAEDRLWMYTTEPLKKLINVDKLKINVMDVNFGKSTEPKVFQIGSEDLEKYMKVDIETEQEEEPVASGPENQFDENIDDDEHEKASSNDLIIEDAEESEVMVEKRDYKKDIFCKQKDLKKKSKTKKKKPKIEVDPKMKLDELQDLALEHDVEIEVAGKTGKMKKKTKAQLIEDLKSV